jgi:hypothetical protein
MFSLTMEEDLGEWSRKCSLVDVSHETFRKKRLNADSGLPLCSMH